jgi:hypothetical protein
VKVKQPTPEKIETTPCFFFPSNFSEFSSSINPTVDAKWRSSHGIKLDLVLALFQGLVLAPRASIRPVGATKSTALILVLPDL